MSKVMVTIHNPGRRPSVEEIQQRYDLSPADIDSSFGVVAIDPDQDLYTILVEPAAAERVTGSDHGEGVRGPFANPPIGPFGPMSR